MTEEQKKEDKMTEEKVKKVVLAEDNVIDLPTTIKIKSGALEVLLQSEGLLNKRFPVKANYWLARVFDKARQEYKPYAKSKQKLLEEHSNEEKSKLMPDGQYHIEPNRRAEFNEKLEELVSTEIDLGIHKIEVDEKDIPDLTVREMETLLPIFIIKGV